MTGDNILFSNDAFGQHFAVAELFNDKANQCLLWHEALKYFTNILNPFAPLVAKKIEEIKALNLPFDIIAPSHGAIWRDNPMQIVEKYALWANAYQENQVTIVYETMWEGTTKIAHRISQEITKQSPDTVVKVFNVAKQDKNEIMTEIFKSKAVVAGSPTAVNDILAGMTGFLAFMKTLKFKNKKAAAFGCYGWSGECVKILQDKLRDSGFNVIEENIKSLWNPTEEDFAKVPELVEKLLAE